MYSISISTSRVGVINETCSNAVSSPFLRFMVNRRIFVVGFGLYGSIHGPSEYAVNVQVNNVIDGFILNCLMLYQRQNNGIFGINIKVYIIKGLSEVIIPRCYSYRWYE